MAQPVEEASDTMGSGSVEFRMPAPMKLDSGTDLLPEWLKFKQQFKIFLTAAGFEKISEVRKAAIFLNSAGHEAQELYFNVLKTEDSTKYEQIVTLFDEYFAPKQNEVINAYNFNQRKQEESENFDSFYTDLRKLVKNCNYDKQEDRMLRDRIVLGVEDKKLQRKLLEINDLTLQKAVDMSRASELSKNQCRAMQQQTTAVDLVRNTTALNNIQRRHGMDQQIRAKYFSSSREYYNCKKCDTMHGPRNCPAFGKQCYNCNKLNHFKKGCKLLKEVHSVNKENASYDNDNQVHDM